VWLSAGGEARFEVHQACDDREFGVVRVERVAEAVRGDAEPLGAANAVLDPDAEAAQACG